MFEDEIQSLREKNLYRSLQTVGSPPGPIIRIQGREMISLASNDYLGLASHRGLKNAACDAAGRLGAGSGASRLLSGTNDLHESLEQEIASYLQCPAALVFNSGYAANTGLIPALCSEEDLILSDALNHASIVDGCRLSKAEVKVYYHLNYNDLEYILKASSKYKRVWIITESLFSMDGDLAPLPKLVEIAEKYGARILLDEAHAMGVWGEKGRGCAAHHGVEQRITLRMGTLGKAMGSFGAFVAGSREIIDLLINRARSFIYSTSLPPSVLGASRAAVELVQSDEGDRLRERLYSNVGVLSRGLAEAGNPVQESPTQILPLILGSAERAMKVSESLFEQGIFAPAIRPPTVPEAKARIRLSLMATHDQQDLRNTLSAIRKALTVNHGS